MRNAATDEEETALKPLIVAVMAIIVIVLILGVKRQSHRDVTVDATKAVMGELDLGPTFEAREWLKANPNRFAFAGNRFESSEEALAFVESLYSAGAMQVLVSGILDEEWRIKQEGGPYADTLIVSLPSDPRQRAALFRIAAQEAEHEDFDPEVDRGQSQLVLWWD